MFPRHALDPRHCEERSDEAIQIRSEVLDRFAGACHRAGHFGPDPLAPSGLRLLYQLVEGHSLKDKGQQHGYTRLVAMSRR